MSAVHIKGLILQFSLSGPVAGWEGSGGCMGVDGRVVGGFTTSGLLVLAFSGHGNICFVVLFLLHTYPSDLSLIGPRAFRRPPLLNAPDN